MRPALAVCRYLAFVFLGGALIAPWIFMAAQAAADASPFWQGLARQPFHRFVNRSFLLLAVVGLWPLVRGLGVNSLREAGFPMRPGAWRELGGGFFLGFVSLLALAVVAVLAGGRLPNTTRTGFEYARHFANAALAAGVVGLLEEALFRGAMLGGLRRSFPLGVALAITSGVYALVHFFDRPPPPDAVNWASGFTTLWQMLHGFVEFERLVPGFFALALAGWILGVAATRTGALYFSIGLHAGWIFWVKTYGFLTDAAPVAHAWFWGTNKFIDGWAAVIALGVVLGVVRLRLRMEDRPGEFRPGATLLR